MWRNCKIFSGLSGLGISNEECQNFLTDKTAEFIGNVSYDFFKGIRRELRKEIYPMCYSDEKYDATIYARDYVVHKLLVNLNNSYTNPLLQFVPDHPWEKEKITLIKKKCHEYDAEWRAILSTPYYLNTPVYKKWKPYGVILGLNMEADSKKLVVNAAETAGITGIFQVGISDSDELELMPISGRKG